MVVGRRNLLARDYEVPKRPIFFLDNMEIVQGTDVAAYVSSGVTDGIMCGTNGCVGVRHRSESESIGFETSVFMNGVYHSLPLDTHIVSEALPEEMQIGATVCEVNIDCLIDGESGTLRVMPTRRLSMDDGTYQSYCQGVMSGDGMLMFDGMYRRVVSLKELDLWGADIVYTGFDLQSSPSESHLDGSPTFSNVSDKREMTSHDDRTSTYSMEFIVTLTVDLDNWDILRNESVDDVLLQSRTSGIIVSTVTQTTCLVHYSDDTSKFLPEQEVLCGMEDSVFSPIDRPLATTAASYMSDSESEPWLLTRAALVPALYQSKRISLKKRFSLTITPENVPQKVTVTFTARHQSGGVSPIHTFPSISKIIEDQREILSEFWDKFHIDVQQQEELTGNRTRLALLNNAFRLFCVSRNLKNGLPRAGCSATRTNMLYDLRQYLYHGIFYILTSPSSALDLIRSLYSLLPQARKNAHHLSLKHGAIFPRNTIKGTECRHYSTVNHARLHVNAEIGYIINFFFAAVEDIDKKNRLWLLELMLETARVWPELGEWVEHEAVFRLDNIAGPDEYNGSASGNFYIHLSAKMHLNNALRLYEKQLEVLGAEAIGILLKQIDMNTAELNNFRATADGIVIRRNDHLGVYMVHNHFHTLAEWKGDRPKHPLSMNYHPLAIFRHKVVDIPEVLLGMMLYPDEFEKKDLMRNLAYYEPLCTYDSPESLGILASVDFKANKCFARSMPLLRSLLNLDLDNIIYTADEGLDFGAMSCSWIAIVSGIGGVKLGHRYLHLDPCFPVGLNVVSFTLCWRGATLRTTVDRNCVTYDLIMGDGICFVHGDGHRIYLHSGFNSCVAKRQVAVPRLMSSRHGEFDGAIFYCESLFDDIMEVNFRSWYNTLESLFENYRTLHLREIPPLTAEEFATKVIYQAEQREIAFSGIHNVLLDRNIDLGLGTPDDAEIVETRYGLANAKVAEMAEILSREPLQVNPSFRSLLEDLTHSGIMLAVVTYSRSLKTLMHHNPGVTPFFLASIDGEESYDRHIKSRPHVDIFLRAAEKIHVDPARCIVFSTHLDRGYEASALAQFRMFFDVEERFVTKNVMPQPQPYPTLDPKEAAAAGLTCMPLVVRLPRANLPRTIDALEVLLRQRQEDCM